LQCAHNSHTAFCAIDDHGFGPRREGQRTAPGFLLFGAVFFALSVIAYVATLTWTGALPHDSTGLVVGRDFLNFWMYGRAVESAHPALFYDPHVYNHALQALLGADYIPQRWSYPPSIMLVAVPFGQLGYLPALLLWTAIGLSFFVLIARRAFSDSCLLLALLFSPAAVFCLMSGQNSFITAGVLVIVSSWLDRRPLLAGLLIGCLSLKPQLGLLFPFMLAASGRWRVFAVATAGMLAIAALTAALFGPQVWIDFVLKGLPHQNEVLADPHLLETPFYPTIFMNTRGTGASYAVAMAVQLCFSAAAVTAVVWAFRAHRLADPALLMALFLACSICASPYLLSYDTLALCFAMLFLLQKGGLDATGRRLAQLVYWLPVIQIGFGMVHIPGPALIPVVVACYLVVRLAGWPAAAGEVAPAC
jgi:hypothetical protein